MSVHHAADRGFSRSPLAKHEAGGPGPRAASRKGRPSLTARLSLARAGNCFNCRNCSNTHLCEISHYFWAFLQYSIQTIKQVGNPNTHISRLERNHVRVDTHCFTLHLCTSSMTPMLDSVPPQMYNHFTPGGVGGWNADRDGGQWLETSTAESRRMSPGEHAEERRALYARPGRTARECPLQHGPVMAGHRVRPDGPNRGGTAEQRFVLMWTRRFLFNQNWRA